MEDATRISLKNRTGLQMSPGDAQELLDATGGAYASTSLPDAERNGLAETRSEYIAEAGSLGSVPAPVTPVGIVKSAAKMLSGSRMQVLMDKLAERAAFERSGVRLYDALLAKHRGELEAPGRDPQAAGQVSHDTLVEFRRQEAEHFMLVSDAIKELGGDPTAQTPCADAVGVMSMGLVQTVSDPRTSLAQSVGAILTAELTDVANWDLLARLAHTMGQEEMAQEFREAMAHEERHLQVIRQWHASLVLAESAK